MALARINELTDELGVIAYEYVIKHKNTPAARREAAQALSYVIQRFIY